MIHKLNVIFKIKISVELAPKAVPQFCGLAKKSIGGYELGRPKAAPPHSIAGVDRSLLLPEQQTHASHSPESLLAGSGAAAAPAGA